MLLFHLLLLIVPISTSFLPSFNKGVKEDCPIDEVREIKAMMVDQGKNKFDERIFIVDQDAQIRQLTRKFNARWDGFDPSPEETKKWKSLAMSVKYRKPYWAVTHHTGWYYAMFEKEGDYNVEFTQIWLTGPGDEDPLRKIWTEKEGKDSELYQTVIFFGNKTRSYYHGHGEGRSASGKYVLLEEHGRDPYDFREWSLRAKTDQEYAKLRDSGIPFYIIPFDSGKKDEEGGGVIFITEKSGPQYKATTNITKAMLLEESGGLKPFRCLEEKKLNKSGAVEKIFNKLYAVFYDRSNASVAHGNRWTFIVDEWEAYKVDFASTATGWSATYCRKLDKTQRNVDMIDSIKERFKSKGAVAAWSDSPEYYHVAQKNQKVRDFDNLELLLIALNYGKKMGEKDFKEKPRHFKDGLWNYHIILAVTENGYEAYQFERFTGDNNKGKTTLKLWYRGAVRNEWGYYDSDWEFVRDFPRRIFPPYIIWDSTAGGAAVFNLDGSYTSRAAEYMEKLDFFANIEFTRHRPRIYSLNLPTAKSAAGNVSIDPWFNLNLFYILVFRYYFKI